MVEEVLVGASGEAVGEGQVGLGPVQDEVAVFGGSVVCEERFFDVGDFSSLGGTQQVCCS